MQAEQSEYSELPLEVYFYNRRKTRTYGMEVHVDFRGTLDQITLCGTRSSVCRSREEVPDETPVTCWSCIEGILAGFADWHRGRGGYRGRADLSDVDVSTYWTVGGDVLAGSMQSADYRRWKARHPWNYGTESPEN